MAFSVGHLLNDLTGGRPFAFMIMPFGDRFDLFLNIKTMVSKTLNGMLCLRADEIKGSGHDLLAKIHLLIERADLVIADISPVNGSEAWSANVFYEIGYARALGKHILLLVREPGNVPTDLRGLEVIRHSGSRAGFAEFQKEFRAHLRTRLTSRAALLRDMLVADAPRPSYVLASPKYPTESSKIPGQVKDKRTFGDNLGVLGLIAAFGAILGEHSGVELVSAQYHALDIHQSAANLYLVGSPQVNALTAEVMNLLQDGKPRFRFEKYSPTEDRIVLKQRAGKTWVPLKAMNDGEVNTVDYGIVLRGPHPAFADRILMIMAGAHSLGTGAACLAATNSKLIAQIHEKVKLGEKNQAIYVLVRGQVSRKDRHLDADSVEIIEAGELR